VLYEMLTGRRVFQGEDVSLTLAEVMKSEPEWSALPAATPTPIRRLLRRCLEKESHRRLRDIGDARIELDDAGQEPELAAVKRRVRVVEWLPWTVAAVLAGALLWLLNTAGERPLDPGLSRRFTLTPQELFGQVPAIALSPNGRHLAYLGRPHGERERLFAYDLHEGTVRGLASTLGANHPFFSPDGDSVAFFSEGQLRKADLDGGPSQAICDIPDFFGGSWTTTGEIVYGTPNAGLFVVRASGGVSRAVTTPPDTGTVSHRWPHVLPDGDGVLFTVWDAEQSPEHSMGWASLETGETKVVGIAGSRPILLEERYLVYASDGVLKGVDFDPESATVRGEPVPLVDVVFTGADGYVPYGVSDDGLLVYASSEDRLSIDAAVIRVDRQGREDLLVSAPGHSYRQPTLSPDGRRLALSHFSRGGIDLRLFDLERRTLSVITPRFGAWPVWTPDGRRVAFVGQNLGQWNVHSAAADGRGEVAPVMSPLEVRQCPTSYSPEGVLVFERGPIGARDIWLFDPQSDPSTRPFLATEANERGARFSPDGVWIAFTSDQSGREEVYVARASGEGDIIPISNDGGREPLWAHDLEELFYRNGTQMMSVPISIGDELEPGSPAILFEGEYSYGYLDWSFNYDVSPDGRYFYMVKESEELEPRLQAVTNWTRELEGLISMGR
jgi:serine/threonine-protein kinase